MALGAKSEKSKGGTTTKDFKYDKLEEEKEDYGDEYDIYNDQR